MIQGLEAKQGTSELVKDWMVVDAICDEPVSGTNSLVTGKITRNVTNNSFGLDGAISHKIGFFSALRPSIPWLDQGIQRAMQGFFRRMQATILHVQ